MNMATTSENAWQVYKNADLLYSKNTVQEALDRMATEIFVGYEHKNPILVCVMNGGVVPFSEILQRLEFPMQTDYIHATRYGGNLTGGQIAWLAEPRINPEGRHILVIDDILDEGETLASIVDYYNDKKAASVRTAVLVVKDRPRKIDYMADYVGLHVPNRYVFGCGMDYKDYLRNLPGIYAENKNNKV
jgi:hypoxanthine phosphoribosyltransferase